MNSQELETQKEDFFTELKNQEKAAKTIKAYKEDLVTFFDYLHEALQPEQELAKADIINYKEHLKSLGRSTATINRRIVCVNKFLKFCGADELTGTKQIKVQQKTSLKNVMTQADYERLLRCAIDPPPQARAKGMQPDLRSWTIMQTLANTGIRIGELQYFTVEALNAASKNGDCITVDNKGKQRNIPVSKDLQKLLKSYCEQQKIKNGYIFGTKNGNPISNEQFTRKIKRIAGYARVNKDKVHCHGFRHFFGKTYMKEIGRIDELADILGHSNISTTRIYSRTSNKEKAQNINKLDLLHELPDISKGKEKKEK